MRRHKLFGCVVLPLLVAAAACLTPEYGLQASSVSSGTAHVPGGDSARDAPPTRSHIDQLLQLTPEQQARNKAILDDANHQFTNLRNQQNISPQEKMQRAAAINESVHGKLMAVLTHEQRSKLAAQQLEQMQIASSRVVENMDQHVHLSAAQKLKMLSLVSNAMKQEHALGDDNTLSMSQKMAAVRSLQQSFASRMKALLTQRQRKIVEAHNAQMEATRSRANGGQ